MKKIIVTAVVVLIITSLVVLQKIGILNKESIVVSSNINSNSQNSQGPTPFNPSLTYKDGVYTGKVTDAIYGNFQVRAIIKNEKIADIEFLQYPNDRETSNEINSQSNPLLKQEAILAQSANVDIVTGATQSSIAFRKSLQSALDKAM